MLKPDYLVELARTCLNSKDILEIVKQQLNTYVYFPKEAYKVIFKYLFDYHTVHDKPPTAAIMEQNIKHIEALEIIARIKKANVHDHKDQILLSLEEFIKRTRFTDLHKRVADLMNQGKHEEAYSTNAKESNDINTFSLKRKQYTRIFRDFDKRQAERQKQENVIQRKVPTGIPQFDYHTRGGIERGTGLLAVARSGAGKTTFLRHLGASAAFRGINVLHLASGDSTDKDVNDGYDSWWTGVSINDIREGRMPDDEMMKKIERAKNAYLGNAGEIFTHVFKQFHSASIMDARNILMDLLIEYDIGLVLFDLLDTFVPGDGRRYGTNQEGTTASKKATAEKIINIATEFNVAVAAVTQASDIKPEQWNNANFVIRRGDISNLKAAVDPFAYVITLNQTEDENENEVMRIHEEKLRHYKIKQWEATYPIAQNREFARFVDLAETNRKFWDNENKRVIKQVAKKAAA